MTTSGTGIGAFEPAPDDVVRDLHHRALALQPHGAGKAKPSLQELAYLGARLGPVLSRLARVQAELAGMREELEHTRPAADAAVAWTAACESVDVESRPLEDTLYEAACALRAWRAVTGRDESAQEWLIWSREWKSWWGPGGNGYFGDITCAGRFSREQATQMAFGRSWRSDTEPPEVVIPAPPGYLLTVRKRLAAYVDRHIAEATAAAVAERLQERKVVSR
ncbi:hypothetical protein ACIBTV_25635 [Micromonospora sp. NPDC049366]|uniref:hypothetical protein n=1 Tax=Micromonospora sp. NPDC049366 TaxID=3364271 RepID=UPI0037AC668B